MPSPSCTGGQSQVRIRKLPALLSLIALSYLPAHAAPPGQTNEAAISYTSSSVLVENRLEMDVLKEHFIDEVGTSEDVVFDRVFGPAAELAWVRRLNTLHYGAVERFNSEGANLFSRIGVDSLRDAAVEAFPTDFWTDHWLGWFANLVSGTIGNSEEERIQLTSVSYSAVRSAWERSGTATFQWGLRPWNTTPYVYFLLQAGHFEGKPLLTLESRAGYTIMGSSKVETRLTLALPASCRIAASASMDPGRVNSGDAGSRFFGVTLERLIGERDSNPTSLFYVGFRAGIRDVSSNPRHENMIVAGLFRKL